MERAKEDQRNRAIKRWVKHNLSYLEVESYTTPEDHELVEGGFWGDPDASSKELFLSAYAPQASTFGLKIVEEKEYDALVKRCAKLERTVEKLSARAARLESENKQLRTELSLLPKRRYRVVKPFGIFSQGHVLETYDLEWAGRLVERGVLERLNASESGCADVSCVNVEQFCLGKTVKLLVRGKLKGRLADGVVENCSDAGTCNRSDSCWVGKRILTIVESLAR